MRAHTGTHACTCTHRDVCTHTHTCTQHTRTPHAHAREHTRTCTDVCAHAHTCSHIQHAWVAESFENSCRAHNPLVLNTLQCGSPGQNVLLYNHQLLSLQKTGSNATDDRYQSPDQRSQPSCTSSTPAASLLPVWPGAWRGAGFHTEGLPGGCGGRGMEGHSAGSPHHPLIWVTACCTLPVAPRLRGALLAPTCQAWLSACLPEDTRMPRTPISVGGGCRGCCVNWGTHADPEDFSSLGVTAPGRVPMSSRYILSHPARAGCHMALPSPPPTAASAKLGLKHCK